MNFEVKIKNNSRINTFSDQYSELKCIGHVWEKELLSSLCTKDLEFKYAVGVIKNITGFFSLVYQNEKQLIASVDHIRSHPIFYGQTNTTFYLSDCAEWVREMVKDISMDEQAKAEFQLTGYVTGSDTLYKNVKQLQAGECLSLVNGKLELSRYYRFLHIEPAQYNEQELLLNLDKVAKESIKRLIKYANGKQIVVPLSGGYDSRLIATLLKETGYENILTFTYGVKGNKEAEYSKKVADALGLKWMFIEYTNELWSDSWHTAERKAYQVFGSGWSSIPHIQDWLAVKIMKQQGMVEPNAIFVPGHTGDFISGGHIPKHLFNDFNAKYNIKDVFEAIYSKHYSLVNNHSMIEGKNNFFKKVLNGMEVNTVETAYEFADTFEKWEWQERQSKFIFNSVRVYEFFGYDWWIPLWDKEFVQFFERLPLKLRSHDWYKEYVRYKYLSNTSEDLSNELGNTSEEFLSRRIASLKIIEALHLKEVLSKIYKKIFKPRSHLSIETRFDKEETYKLTEQGYSSNGKDAYFFLQENSNV